MIRVYSIYRGWRNFHSVFPIITTATLIKHNIYWAHPSSLSDSLLSTSHEWPHLILPILLEWIFLLHMKKLRLREVEQFSQGHRSNKGQRQSHTHALKTLQETASHNHHLWDFRAHLSRIFYPPKTSKHSYTLLNHWVSSNVWGFSSSDKRKFTFYCDCKCNEDRH